MGTTKKLRAIGRRLTGAFQTIGGVLIFIVIFVAFAGIGAGFLLGAEWAAEKLLPLLLKVGWYALGIDLLILLPLSIARPLRAVTGIAIFVSSFLFGLITWLAGFSLAFSIWGVWGVMIGLFILGIGVVPVALLATLIKGMWADFFILLLFVAVSIGCRLGGIAIAESANSDGGNKYRFGSILGVFRRAFSRTEVRPYVERPKGYKLGYVFAVGYSIGGIVCVALAMASLVFLGSNIESIESPEEVIIFVVISLLGAIIGLISLAISICAFIRRFPACYLVIAIGLVANIAFALLEAVLEALQGKWSDFVRSLVGALVNVAWLAYFGNRRHMFGYLKDDVETLTSVETP